MRYSLSQLVDVVVNNRSVYFITDEMFCLDDCTDEIIEVINKLKQGCEIEELTKVIGNESTKELLEELKELNILRVNYENKYKNTIVEHQVEYFDSLSDLPNEMQERLCEKTVCILGVGGVGAIVLQHLISAGIKSFILIDNDKVEINNFNRQFIYNRHQFGESKMKCAKEYAFNISDDIKVITYSRFINSVNDLDVLKDHNIDFFVCAADLPANKIQIITNEFCYRNNIPFSFASVGINCGTWGPLIIPYKSLCYECFCKEEDNDMTKEELFISKNLNPKIKASFGVTNTITSTFLAQDIIYFLSGYEEIHTINTRISYNFTTMEFIKFTSGNKVCECMK